MTELEDRQKRWDTDARGHGVASGRMLAPDVESLRETLDLDDWVAEEPEAHLLPHIRQAVDALAGDLTLVDSAVGSDGLFVVRLRHAPGLGTRAVRRAAWQLIGAIAESSSFVRERFDEAVTTFDLVTGKVAGDAGGSGGSGGSPEPGFAPHGHTVRLVVASGD